MTIAVILSNKGSEVVSVPARAPVREAVTLLSQRGIGAAPVLDEGRILGIFSERDLVKNIADHGSICLDWPVERIMSSPAVTIDPSTDVLAALATMTKRRIRHLPVVESGQIRGIVSIGDLVKFRIERIEAEAEALRTYIQSA
ncbi:CBS domain-containing protein [Sphingomonas xanthus]|uniref:CBS domain-containing protein n=1 Tax=Sphingomonas xanthus TaxID=2594473 RepID=A0A516IRX6_9SPHN|nr:CBS domain-containing protein [Sphingomonas xanthus]QDP19646.1 CBS domain-containing protein [Sphingomonas xanthus]